MIEITLPPLPGPAPSKPLPPSQQWPSPRKLVPRFSNMKNPPRMIGRVSTNSALTANLWQGTVIIQMRQIAQKVKQSLRWAK